MPGLMKAWAGLFLKENQLYVRKPVQKLMRGRQANNAAANDPDFQSIPCLSCAELLSYRRPGQIFAHSREAFLGRSMFPVSGDAETFGDSFGGLQYSWMFGERVVPKLGQLAPEENPHVVA